MKDTLVIVAGDCGFGFERKGYYENIVKRNAKRVNESNNRFLFMRGNHDNPAYFDGNTFRHKRFTCIPDYSVVKANGHTILCVGGAISVDRQPRIDTWEHNQRKAHRCSHNSVDDELIAPNYYWQDEAPVFNNDLLSENTSYATNTSIHTVKIQKVSSKVVIIQPFLRYLTTNIVERTKSLGH